MPITWTCDPPEFAAYVSSVVCGGGGRAAGAEDAMRKILAAAGALRIGKIGEAEERLGEALEALGVAD